MLRIGQVEATATQDGKYTDGSVAGGIAATRLRAAAFNAMQEELAHIVESAGLALDINDMTQVLKAIQKLTLSRANPFADIKSDGAAAISTALTNLGLIGKSNRRNRRPASDELDMLIEGLQQRSTHKCSKIPFVDILKFSVWSCMRIGEVCRLRWEDLDQEQKSILVRDRKDPRKKEGNHMKVALLGEAWDIVQRQPKKSEFIFPYNSTSVTAGFQRVRSKLGIKDLRYHDLRREGASRLFEAGFSIEEVAQVTGHRSLNVLWQVYTELYPKSLHNRFEELQRSRNKTS